MQDTTPYTGVPMKHSDYTSVVMTIQNLLQLDTSLITPPLLHKTGGLERQVSKSSPLKHKSLQPERFPQRHYLSSRSPSTSNQ